MESPFAILYELIMARIKTEVSDIRYINQDLGQLENYNPQTGRPAVTMPCALIDFDNFNCEDWGQKVQHLEGDVIIRVALDTWSNASSITPIGAREKALSYYELEYLLYKALHGWTPPYETTDPCKFGALTRVAFGTEKRDDAIRVRVIRFRMSIDDHSAKVALTKVPATPDVTFGNVP